MAFDLETVVVHRKEGLYGQVMPEPPMSIEGLFKQMLGTDDLRGRAPVPATARYWRREPGATQAVVDVDITLCYGGDEPPTSTCARTGRRDIGARRSLYRFADKAR